MATVSKGTRTTSTGLTSSRLKVDMGDLHKLEDNEGALVVTLGELGKKPAFGKSINWHTSELRPKFDRINNGAGYTSGDTAVVVDNGAYFQDYDNIKFTRTGEVARVSSVSGNTLTIVRSWGATAAAALVDNDEILILGPAYPEGTKLKSPRSVTEVEFTNYTELVRHNFTISGTLRAVGEAGGLYHGNDVDLQRRDMMLSHKRDLNLKFLHSEGAQSGDTRTLDGIIPFVTTNGTNRTNSTATLTEKAWNDGLRVAFRNANSNKLLAIMSRSVAGIINEFASSVQRVTPGTSKFGLRLMDYTSPHGEVRMITDVALEGDELSKYIVLIDPVKGPVQRVLRDTILIKDRTDDRSEDAYAEEILTETSVEWGHPDKHYIFNAITA